jgi:hypothetical protein
LNDEYCRIVGALDARELTQDGFVNAMVAKNLLRFSSPAPRAATPFAWRHPPDGAGYPPGVEPVPATMRETRSSAGVTR